MYDALAGWVIVRSEDAGAHFGWLVEVTPDAHGTMTVLLRESRRLWRWWAAQGVGLGGVAASGLHPDREEHMRIGLGGAHHLVTGVCEIIECTPRGAASVRNQPARAGTLPPLPAELVEVAGSGRGMVEGGGSADGSGEGQGSQHVLAGGYDTGEGMGHGVAVAGRGEPEGGGDGEGFTGGGEADGSGEGSGGSRLGGDAHGAGYGSDEGWLYPPRYGAGSDRGPWW